MGKEREGRSILGTIGDLGTAAIRKMNLEGFEFGGSKISNGTLKRPGRRRE